MNRQKGFILPVVLFLALAACSMVISGTDIYLGEKKYAVLVKEYYLRNTMSLFAIREAAQKLGKGDKSPGELRFSDGKVSYNIKQDGDTAVISLTAENESGEPFKSTIRYNQTEKKVLQWEER
ncbi:competence type IV pilus minor pilin ComGG [Heyndrickxia coagulans]|uniref:competence type IV pilus minor pilin ComGG n=1 Tax=Heyndrickxia coagulans TaxID=1398 RepID=UPI0023E429E8|nr:competence type IV pilus minor pilin ComGG [Heyndrickxia coagulans]